MSTEAEDITAAIRRWLEGDLFPTDLVCGALEHIGRGFPALKEAAERELLCVYRAYTPEGSQRPRPTAKNKQSHPRRRQ